MKRTSSRSLRERWRRKRRRQLFVRFLLAALVLAAVGAGVYLLARGGRTKEEPSPAAERSQSLPSIPPAEPPPSPSPKEETKEPEKTPGGKAADTKDLEQTKKPQAASVEEDYFDDAVFIGDSRTEGFGMFSGLKKAAFYTGKGLMVDTIFEDTVKVDKKRMTIPDALKKKKFGKVYIMLGVNELGWYYEDIFIDKYTELLDVIKKAQPDAVIYVQSILHVSKKKSSGDKIYNNKKINERNKLLKKMAKKEGVYYLNVNEAVTGEDGALPPDASADGVHLNAKYCKLWKEYLMAHAVNEE